MTIGYIKITANGKTRHRNIEYVEGYGWICPGEVTTNGYKYLLAQFLESRLAAQSIELHQDIPDYSVEVWLKGNKIKAGEVLKNL